VSNFKIGICLLTYNCVNELKDCLESVDKFYPVIVIDGKWKDFPDNHPTSIDGTLELAESYSNVVTILSPNGTEVDNRNLSCEYAGKYDCDVVIILDSDERLDLPNGLDNFYQSLERMIIQNPQDIGFKTAFESKKRGGVSFPCRIYLNPKHIRYRDKHNKIYYKNKEMRYFSSKLCPNIIIHEDQTHRTEGRLQNMSRRNIVNPEH